MATGSAGPVPLAMISEMRSENIVNLPFSAQNVPKVGGLEVGALCKTLVATDS